jgi:NADPH-dependent 2,4-dienoyl-CoA reductase/sulfur reductase-like enzyme
VHAAAALRRDGYHGGLTILDAQPHHPYDRPPLSKELLTGRFGPDDIGLRSAEGLDVVWKLGRPVHGVVRDGSGPGGRGGRLVAGDEEIVFDGLVIATGADARTLPGTDHLADVGVLRTLDDAVALRDAIDAGISTLLVVGAGFIGLEVAASARQRGVEVVVVESLGQPLGRILGDDVGAFVARAHRAHGVDLRLETGVSSLVAAASGGVEAQLSDGSVIHADRVVVGIGVRPATDWLAGAGLVLDDGVVCDETLSAAPGVVAAGDVARWPSRRAGRLMRVEHWDHAIASGEAAARRLLAGPDAEIFDPVPWFWSDQHDMKIQLVGFAGPDLDSEVVSGSFEEDRVAVAYGRGGVLVGMLGINRPRHVALMREQVTSGVSFADGVAAARAL